MMSASVLGGTSPFNISMSTYFGKNDGETKDFGIAYGMMFIKDISKGLTCLYSIGNSNPYLIYPATQPNSFSIAKNGANVRITKIGSADVEVLQVKFIYV